jgi:hypothetical protein
MGLALEGTGMISRITLVSFLLALLLASGTWYWDVSHTDDCTRYLSGDFTASRVVEVPSGSRTIRVSCNRWYLRQPDHIQILCVVDLVLGVVFLMNAWGDARDRVTMRRHRREVPGEILGE